MKLRHYQDKAVNMTRTAFAQGAKSLILCAPTGSGKTVTFAHIGQQAALKGKRVMVLCDRKELIGQAQKKLVEYGMLPTIIAPGHRNRNTGSYIASVDTLRRRERPEIDLLIVDEAHKQTFDKIVAEYKERGAFIIGATATPQRTGTQTSLDTLYDTMVEPISIPELVGEGYLADARTFSVQLDTSSVKSTKGDYDEKSMLALFTAAKLYDGVIEQYKKFTPNTKAICFNINVEHSKQITAMMNAAGISARHLDGTMPDGIRRQTLIDFRLGLFQVLNNCSVLTTGYDEDTIETVIVNRATQSLPLWLQMTGRGSRPNPNKNHFNIIDMGGNVHRLGLWEMPREWSLVKKAKKKEEQLAAPVKSCPACDAMLHTSVMLCKVCGHVFVKEETPLAQGVFYEVEKVQVPQHLRKSWRDLTVPQLMELQELMKYKHGWIVRQLKDRGRAALEEYAAIKGYAPGWVLRQVQEGVAA